MLPAAFSFVAYSLRSYVHQSFWMLEVEIQGEVLVGIVIRLWLHLIGEDFRADLVLLWIFSSSSLKSQVRKVNNILGEAHLAQQAV